MKLKKRFAQIILLALIQLLPGSLLIGQEQENTRIITLDEFIRLACSKDTVFQEILIDELALKYRKALTLPAGDIVLSVESQYDLFFNPDEQDTENSVSLSKLFPYTGTDISAEYSSSVGSSTRTPSSEFTASVSQPIAENAFGRNTRLLDKITGIEIDVARHQIAEAYEDYLASLIQIYYDWYSAYENLKTGRSSYNENVKLLENIREREKNKVALPIDVNKINLQVIAKEENLISLEEKYIEYLNLVKQALRYEGAEDLLPQDSSLYASLVADFRKDYDKFRENSRTSLILKLLEEKSSVEVDKYADELLPSINLFAGYSLSGSGHGIESKEKTVFAGLSLDWPFPGETERAGYETARIGFEKAKLSSDNIHIRLYTGLLNLNQQIEREKKLISLADEKISLAQSIVDEETKNYSLGRVTLNDLIDEINRLEDNKFSKISHQIQLKKLIIEWLRLTDTLIK
ncbi:TolC family protein [Candidatus Omnitrophota bacterium]